MRIGAHISIGGGWGAAADYAHEVGCECVQVFTKSPRTWKASPLNIDGVSEFQSRLAEYGIGPVFAHTSYLLNFGTEDDVLRERSIRALGEELDRAGEVGAAGVVTHLGTSVQQEPVGSARVAESLIAAVKMRQTATDVELLLEDTAGAGTTFGGDLAVLASVTSQVQEATTYPCGICLDTCHAHAYGYDLTTIDGWMVALAEIEDGGQGVVVRVVHANDAIHPRGSRKDRHAWIGEGQLGLDAFAVMFKQEMLADAAVIIEMPGEAPEKDRENILRLVELRRACRARA